MKDNQLKIKDRNKETDLIKGILDGDEAAFKQLRQRYKNAIRGYIASRSFFWTRQSIKGVEKESDIDHEIQEIEQETWIEVWKKISTYDSEKASLYRFIRIWADIMIKRNFYKKNREVLISSLKGHLPEEDSQESIEETLDRIFIKTSIVSPEEYLENCEKFLKLTMSYGGPPHQIIVFGFNKLIEGWGPKDIVKELSPSGLRDLSQKLAFSYREESRLPGYTVDNCFKPLNEKMSKKVEEVLEDEVSRKTYINLLRLIVGRSILNQYYGKDPEHNISDWSDKVRKRVLRLIKENLSTREK